MQVEVKIGDIGLAANDVNLQKIQIANPKGSIAPVAFSAERIDVRAPVTNYLKDAIVIDALEINNIYMSLEFTSPTATSGNWTTIMDNMKKSSPASDNQEKSNKTISLRNLS